MIYKDHIDYTTLQEFNKLRTENFSARLKEASLASKRFCKKRKF